MGIISSTDYMAESFATEHSISFLLAKGILKIATSHLEARRMLTHPTDDEIKRVASIAFDKESNLFDVKLLYWKNRKVKPDGSYYF